MTDDTRECPSANDSSVPAEGQAEVARAGGNWRRLAEAAEALIKMARERIGATSVRATIAQPCASRENENAGEPSRDEHGLHRAGD